MEMHGVEMCIWAVKRLIGEIMVYFVFPEFQLASKFLGVLKVIVDVQGNPSPTLDR